MYQKSPFPYLLILIIILSVSGITSFTLDKEIEEPIVFRIQKSDITNSSSKVLSSLKYNRQQKLATLQ